MEKIDVLSIKEVFEVTTRYYHSRAKKNSRAYIPVLETYEAQDVNLDRWLLRTTVETSYPKLAQSWRLDQLNGKYRWNRMEVSS